MYFVRTSIIDLPYRREGRLFNDANLISYNGNNLRDSITPQTISSFIAAAVPFVFSSAFRIQHAEHLNAMHLLILLYLPLRVLHLRENVTSCLRNLFAKICPPI